MKVVVSTRYVPMNIYILGITYNCYIYIEQKKMELPAKIDLLVEEEEINDGYHDLDDGDEGCSENWTPLVDTPGHYQEARCGRHDALVYICNQVLFSFKVKQGAELYSFSDHQVDYIL